MTDEELKSWTDRRAVLFPNLKVPAHANAAIMHDTRKMDYDTAMAALEAYAVAKPYRGFWLADWMRHYDRARTERSERQTDSGLKAAAAALAERNEREQAIRDQQAEIAAYARLSPDVIERAMTELKDIGYHPDPRSRAWRFIVLAWDRGEDVGKYRVDREKVNGSISRTVRTISEQIADLRCLIASSETQLERLLAMSPAR